MIRIIIHTYGLVYTFKQHLHLWRDVNIVMVNGMMPWGNRNLLPLGPLREPLTALSRANIVVVHHADLVCFAAFVNLRDLPKIL